MIISTGMANLKEIDTTFNLAKNMDQKILYYYIVSAITLLKRRF